MNEAILLCQSEAAEDEYPDRSERNGDEMAEVQPGTGLAKGHRRYGFDVFDDGAIMGCNRQEASSTSYG